MAQIQTQTMSQTQKQKQQMTLLQLQTANLCQLSLAELEESIENRLLGDPFLEEGKEPADDSAYDESADDQQEQMPDDIFTDDNIGTTAADDDDFFGSKLNEQALERKERNNAVAETFTESLHSQLIDHDLDEREMAITDFLIGMLDENGFITEPLYKIADELSFKHNIFTDETEVEQCLKTLQTFDPAGIGARDIRECLLLQIDRLLLDDDDTTELSFHREETLNMARTVIDRHYQLMLNSNWAKIQNETGYTDEAMREVRDEIQKLNIRPGTSGSEGMSDRLETVVPDFIIETDMEGNVEMRLNRGNLKPLHISHDMLAMLDTYSAADKHSNRRMRTDENKARSFTRENIEQAQLFIDAIRERHVTLYKVMRAIIRLQAPFFRTHNEDDLRSMILDDVARESGFDLSMVSRVRNSKYASVDGIMYPLSFFFRHDSRNGGGEDINRDKVKAMIRQMVDSEDKNNPLSDSNIAQKLQENGIKIARRTVVNYREELGIPTKKDRCAL